MIAVSQYKIARLTPDDRPCLDHVQHLLDEHAREGWELVTAFQFEGAVAQPVDQMIQAARSGKQNIAEGSKAAGTSKETEIKLTNVARASLEELLIDYQDYLRVRDLKKWEKDSKEAVYVREMSHKSNMTYESYGSFIETRPPEVVANIAICLIHQANFLLDRQIKSLEKDFIKTGGLRERMSQIRRQNRNNP